MRYIIQRQLANDVENKIKLAPEDQNKLQQQQQRNTQF